MYGKLTYLFSLLLSRLLLFFLIPAKKKCYITCAGKSDGMGAQAQAIYSAFLYCYKNKVSYCHTPLADIAHNYDNNASFAKEVETFFSFAKGEKIIHELLPAYTIINLDELNLTALKYILDYLLSENPRYIFQKSHFHNYTNAISADYRYIQASIREKFYSTPKSICTDYSDTKLTIALHIRRGDVSKEDSSRFTNNDKLLMTIGKLSAKLNQLSIPYQLHIYSQGKPEDFDGFTEMAALHLNGNVFSDFCHLVQSDVLFMAKSSYSYSAALLSEAVIVYEPFWHPPLDKWHTIDVFGEVPEDFWQAVQQHWKQKQRLP